MSALHPAHHRRHRDDERMTTTTSTVVVVETETALDWLLRSREHALSSAALAEGTPRAAADAFLCRGRRGRRRGRTGRAKKNQTEGPGEESSEGTGISFVDEILRHHHGGGDAAVDTPHDRRGRAGLPPPGGGKGVVLEVSGCRGTGKTSLLLGLASSYLAATLPPVEDDDDCSDPDHSSSRHNQYGVPVAAAVEATGAGKGHGEGGEGTTTNGDTTPEVRRRPPPRPRPPPPPSVIYLDCEHGLRVPRLVSSVRVSVLREMRRRRHGRGSSGSPVPRNKRRRCQRDGDDDEVENRGGPSNAAGDEGDEVTVGHGSKVDDDIAEEDDNVDRLEDEVTRNLGRIHVAWPRTDGDLTAIMEQISHALRSIKRRHNSSKYEMAASAPTMLVIDSINSFEKRDRMMNGISNSNTDQKGGSGGGGSMGAGGGGTRADFLRQLNRLLSEHPGTIVLASRVVFYPGGGGDGFRSGGGGGKKNDPWNRTVTHRVTLERVAEGTAEHSDGFEFVAVPDRPGGSVVPFSVASGGIFC